MSIETKRNHLTLIALAVAVAGVVGYLLLRSKDSSADHGAKVRRAPAPARTEVVDIARRGRPTLPDQPAVADTDTDTGDEGEAEFQPAVTEDGTEVYARDDGTIVRDHRKANLPPPPPPPVTTKSVVDVRVGLRPLVKECARPIRKRDHTLRGTLHLELTVGVADDKITIAKVGTKLDELEDPAFIECVTSALDKYEMDAPEGQGDVDSYQLALSYPVP